MTAVWLLTKKHGDVNYKLFTSTSPVCVCVWSFACTCTLVWVFVCGPLACMSQHVHIQGLVCVFWVHVGVTPWCCDQCFSEVWFNKPLDISLKTSCQQNFIRLTHIHIKKNKTCHIHTPVISKFILFLQAVAVRNEHNQGLVCLCLLLFFLFSFTKAVLCSISYHLIWPERADSDFLKTRTNTLEQTWSNKIVNRPVIQASQETDTFSFIEVTYCRWCWYIAKGTHWVFWGFLWYAFCWEV